LIRGAARRITKPILTLSGNAARHTAPKRAGVCESLTDYQITH
jgi:hypothetical protein